MKTKHILTAMALPALFAACTAEDIVNEGVNTLQERPTVESLTVKVVEGAESRYAVDGTSSLKFNFETGDKFGAAIIDEYVPNEKPEEWDVIPSLAGNTPFTFNANSGEWKSPEDLPMGLGHYLFVYPYNRADVNRAAVSYELPAVQKLYTKENGEIDLNAAIEAGNKSFYSTVVTSPDVEDLDIYLENLYTYPKFVINFDNGEKVTTVSKVVLAKEGGFEVKGGFNHKAVVAMYANDPENENYSEIEELPIFDEEGDVDWNLVQTAHLLTTDGNYATIETSPYLVAELPLDAEVEKVTNNKSIEVRFMMPGFLMDDDLLELADYTMYVYTNNGAYSFNLGGEDVIAWKKTTKLSSKQKAFARGAANTITIDKDAVKKYNEAPYIVTSIADWNDLVEQYGDNDKFVGDDAINVAVVGGSLVLDKTAKMPSKAEFEVEKLAVAGEVELCNVIAEEVEVKENATLTTCPSLQAGKITNNGKIVVAAAYDKKGIAIECENIDEIINNATLVVEEDAIAAFELTNNKKATFTNEGDTEIEGGSSIGAIVNEGELTITEDFEIEANKDKKGNDLTIVENNGKILSAAELVNNGKIVNDGTITCRHKAGEIVNNGVIESSKGAVTYITDNAEGTIVVAEIDLADYVTVENNNGKISLATKGDVNFKLSETENSIVNTVITTGDLNIKSLGVVTEVIAATEGKLAITGTLPTLTVKEDITLSSNVKVNVLTVAEGAELHIPAAYTMTVASTYANSGVISVYGVLDLTATGIEEGANIGEVEENGSTGEVVYYSPMLSVVKLALKEYINDKDDYVKDGYTIKLASFTAHLRRIAQHNIENRYPKGADCLVYVDELTQSILNTAASSMYTTNETKALVAVLKSWPLPKNPTLFDYKTTVATGKTTAYENFKYIVKHDAYVKNNNNFDYYNVTNLSEAQIDEILKDKYAYIWVGCDLYELCKVWMSYKNFNTGNNDYDASCANTTTLVAWIADVLNTDTNKTPAIGQIQNAIAALGITAANYKYYEGYSPEQVQACCNANAVAVSSKTAQLN